MSAWDFDEGHSQEVVRHDLTDRLPRRTAVVPNLPTPPTGFAVAAYPTYASAQAAVEHLIKHDFSIQDVTIVGSDLQMVERVTGRLTAGKLAAAGAASGAWMGLFVGLLMFVFSPVQGAVLLLILAAVAIGAGVRRGDGVSRLLGGQGAPRLHLGVAGGGPPLRRAVPTAHAPSRPAICCPGWNSANAADSRAADDDEGPTAKLPTGPSSFVTASGAGLSCAVTACRIRPSALALSWSNSAWLIVPLSSSALASAMWSAGRLATGGAGDLLDVRVLWRSRLLVRRTLPLGHAVAAGDDVDQRRQVRARRSGR